MEKPLAELFRPSQIEDVIGQEHLVAEEGIIREMIAQKNLSSILFYGPPGCGKTTIASLYAKAFDPNYISFSATNSRLSELKKIMDERDQSPLFHQKTILFIDEIHRFNQAQQDTFLPLIEKGKCVLIGATTENPSFALNSALLSRLKTFRLNPLNESHLIQIIQKWLKNNPRFKLHTNIEKRLARASLGDARSLFSFLELLQMEKDNEITEKRLSIILSLRPGNYDKSGDNHFNLISALHKSVRGSDPNAALYWLSRILHGGEDRKYVLRRLMRMASEDIGLADPNALHIVCDTQMAFQTLGSPEGELAIANCVVYLSLAPKSNAGTVAFEKALEDAKQTTHMAPPMHILNAPTKWMKKEGYSKGYQYDHHSLHAFSGQNYFPKEMPSKEYYTPNPRGFERELIKRIDFFKRLKNTSSS